MISLELLTTESEASGFRPDIHEKVVLLIELLNALSSDQFLANRLALKGGTAINLFILKLPRLSVDIDLNYIGSVDREIMLSERTQFEHTLVGICEREGFRIKREPSEHAGGKYVLGYTSAFGAQQNIHVDINFMFRETLFGVTRRDSYKLGSVQAIQIPVVHDLELIAGKIAAVIDRVASRDLFDLNELVQIIDWDDQQLRLACVVYGAMSTTDWAQIDLNDIQIDKQELREKLIPVLRRTSYTSTEELSEHLLVNCRKIMGNFLPLRQPEQEFIHLLRQKGVIEPALLTIDKGMQRKISQHPALLWRASRHKV